MTNKRAVSVDELLKKKYKLLQLQGEWLQIFGITQASGVWIIWGESGSGKSWFAMMLARMLTNFGKVAYNSLEEGDRKTIQKRADDLNMKAVRHNFLLLKKETMEDLKNRLRKKKSPDFIIIDSLQYWNSSKKEYIELKEEFEDKLFIFISHADGKLPDGSVAKFVRYDADIKIRVEGFRAFPLSRLGGEGYYTIYPKKADEYWLEIK